MKTYGIQYMGSKMKIVDHITKIALDNNIKSAIDVFTGTTRVAQAFKQNNIKTITSDLAPASRVYSNALIQQQDSSHLIKHIEKMNSLEGYNGWVTQNYSGGDTWGDLKGNGRYIHPKNSIKVDAARDYIETLNLSEVDKDTLICSIIFAMNKVNNSVGQQQAYLKEWCSRAHQDIKFELPPILKGPSGQHITGDCFNIEYPSADLAYLDPPYTPTVLYHNYYHIWDSITLWDKPQTSLKSNRRVDRVASSESYDDSFKDIPWYNKNAHNAFKNILNGLSHIPHIMISYSNESIVSKEDLFKLLKSYGEVSLYEIDHKRMVMGQIGKSTKDNKVVIKDNPNVKEYIFHLKK
jgi:adenine-specific DNA-methyltransferase